MSMMEMFWTWKVKLTPTQMCHRSICHDFPLLWCSTGHETHFSGTIKQIEIQTTDNCSNTALSTRQMTLVQVKSNCSWNPILCYRPIKGSETVCRYHTTVLRLFNLTPKTSVAILKGRNKRWSLPEISSAEVEEIQHSHTSHPVTRVQTCDTTPHTSDRVSSRLQQIHPQWKQCLRVRTDNCLSSV